MNGQRVVPLIQCITKAFTISYLGLSGTATRITSITERLRTPNYGLMKNANKRGETEATSI
jgi:hypothetical protein